MKILIISHGRWGKDTLAEIWKDEFGLTFESSSMAAARIFIYDLLKSKYRYKTFEECYEDRHNHRSEWFDLISEYNKDDKTRLAREILDNSSVYVGMRSLDEITACLRDDLFDLVVWVDASKRVAPETSNSFKIDKSIADIIIENNTDINTFKNKAIRLGKALKL